MSYLTAKGWLTKKEREFIYKSALDAGNRANILNVGVEYGASVVCILEANPTALIHAVDIDTSKYVGPLRQDLYLIQESSREFFSALFKEEMYKLAFIDGDHSYEGTLNDASEAGIRLLPGGVISFHDCYSWDAPKAVHAICPEVNRAVDKWLESNKDKFEELPYIDSIRAFRRKE